VLHAQVTPRRCACSVRPGCSSGLLRCRRQHRGVPGGSGGAASPSGAQPRPLNRSSAWSMTASPTPWITTARPTSACCPTMRKGRIDPRGSPGGARTGQAAIDEVGEARRETLAQVQDLDQAQAVHSPAPGRWSVGEGLDHLLRADQEFLRIVRGLVARKRRGAATFEMRGVSELGEPWSSLAWPVRMAIDVPVALGSLLIPGELPWPTASTRRAERGLGIPWSTRGRSRTRQSACRAGRSAEGARWSVMITTTS